MKIIFFNRFFFPDASATSQILSDLAFHLAARGHDVHVVATATEGEGVKVETIRAVTVHRVVRPSPPSSSLARRALAYAGYVQGARRVAGKLIERGDIVVLKTDPPLLSAALGHLARAKGARVVVWLQDLFPEVAKEYGIAGMKGALGNVLRHVRDRSLAAADDVVTIGSSMAAHVTELRASQGRMHVVHNWADGRAISIVNPPQNTLRDRWELQKHFVVGYSGNLGRVHEFETMLDAAALLQGDAGVQFLVIGRGPRLAEVQARVKREGLANVRFEPHQDRSLLSQSLCVPDVHLSVLRPNFEGLVHPSKLYGIMAAGRPTIFVGSPHGETAAILDRAGAGITVETGDAAGLAAAIRRLRDNSPERERMGMRAREAFDREYDMPIALRQWESLLGL